MRCRDTGTTRGVCETGSSMTRLSRPKTVRTTSSVTTSRGVPSATTAAVAKGDEVVGVARREVQVVQHHHDRGAATGVEVGQQVEHLDLVGDVEVRRRLVEQQQVRSLRQRHRDPDPLALAARELVDHAVGQPERVRQLERLRDGLVVGAGPAPEGAVVRVPATADEVDDGDALGRDRVLRQQPQDARDLLGGLAVDDLAVEQHRARPGLEQPRQTPQQGGLAAGVGADDDGHLAVGDLQVQVVTIGRSV